MLLSIHVLRIFVMELSVKNNNNTVLQQEI